jgi:hypothetical protein
MQDLTKLQIPDGWKLEGERMIGDQALLVAPIDGTQYMATIDFSNRGYRSGCVYTGRFVGDDFLKKKTRKTYTGRGWAQQLVNDAVDFLRDVAK